jgi:hypothetical protein
MDWNRIRIPVSRSLWISRLLSRLACAVPLIILAPPSRANTVVFATGTQMLAGYAENAKATFDINNTTHTITVHLLNLQLNPSDADQAIGSLRFTLTGAGTPIPNATLTGISDTRLDINNSNGTPINVSEETSTVWQTNASSQAGAWQVALCAVCAAGGTDGLIIGGPDATTDGKYAAANSTLRGGNTAQWIIGSGLTYSGNGVNNRLAGKDTSPDFTIAFPAITNLSNVVITNVIFGFGESPNYGWNSITVPVETPEPDSAVLFGTGFGLVAIAVCVGHLRRR